MKRRFAAVLLLAVLLAGCKQSQVTQTLQAVVAAASAVLPVLFATSTVPVPPAIQAAILNYLQGIGKAAREATDILESYATPAEKGTRIAALFAAVSAPRLPAGTPAEVARTVMAVTQAVADFLAIIGHGKLSPRAAKGPPPKTQDITAGDRQALPGIRADAERLLRETASKR
jgi:type III secretory pathway lipoprotein EscJ